MLKRFKRFFALPVIVAIILPLLPGVPLFRVGSASAASSTTVAAWNFPNDPDDAIIDQETAVNESKIIQAVGTNAPTFDVSGATTQSARATGWDNGADTKYWLIDINTVGYQNIQISSKQRSSDTGPKEFKLQYTENGSMWYDIGDSIVVADNFVSGVLSNLALPSNADSQVSLQIRWIMTSNIPVSGESVGSAGVSNIDDILVTGEAIGATVPDQVVNLEGNISAGKASLTWKAVAGATDYNIYFDDQTGTLFEVDRTASTPWVSPELKTIGDYQFAVTAYNEVTGLESELSDIITLTNPTKIYNFSADVPLEINNKVELISPQDGKVVATDWGDDYSPALPNTVSVFGHYYSFESNPGPTAELPIELRFNYTNDDLLAARMTEDQLTGVYYLSDDNIWQLYTNTGVNKVDDYVWVKADHFTPIVSGADTIAPTSAIEALPAVESNAKFNLTIDATDTGDSGLDYTKIYYRQNGGIWTLAGQTATNQFEFSSAADGTYDFYSITVDKAGNEETPTVDSLGNIIPDATTTVDTIILGQVTNIQAVTGNGKVTLTWDAVAGANGYLVSYGLSSGNMTTVDVGNMTTATIIGLENGQSYVFSVAAYGAANNRNGQAVTITATPKAPVTAGPTIIPVAEAAESVQPTVTAPTQTIQPQTSNQQIVPSTQTPSDEGQVKGEETAQPKNWTTVIVLLSILVILSAAVAGYYSYQWWMERPKKTSRSKSNSKPVKDKGKNRW